MKAKQGFFARIAQVLRSLNDIKRELSDTLRLEDEIRARKIVQSADLDHEFIRKLVKSAVSGFEIKLTMRDGTTLEIFEPKNRPPEAEKGSPTW